MGSHSQYYKVSFVSSGSMVPWDPSARAHMGILGVRGLLSLDVASRHKLSCTGRDGTIPLGDLWAGDGDKITWRRPGYSSKGNSRQLKRGRVRWVGGGVFRPKPKSHRPEGRA